MKTTRQQRQQKHRIERRIVNNHYLKSSQDNGPLKVGNFDATHTFNGQPMRLFPCKNVITCPEIFVRAKKDTLNELLLRIKGLDTNFEKLIHATNHTDWQSVSDAQKKYISKNKILILSPAQDGEHALWRIPLDLTDQVTDIFNGNLLQQRRGYDSFTDMVQGIKDEQEKRSRTFLPFGL